MSARTTEAIAAELARLMPTHLSGPADPLLGGYAAAFQAGEAAGYDGATTTTIGGAEGKWLDLVALGAGLRRAEGEDDATLRTRIQSPDRGITPDNLKAVCDAVLDGYGLGECAIVEWFDIGALDEDYYLDNDLISGGPGTFVVVVPADGDAEGFAFVDVSYLDEDIYLGVGSESPVYAAIYAALTPLTAAGVHFTIYIDSGGLYLA